MSAEPIETASIVDDAMPMDMTRRAPSPSAATTAHFPHGVAIECVYVDVDGVKRKAAVGQVLSAQRMTTFYLPTGVMASLVVGGGDAFQITRLSVDAENIPLLEGHDLSFAFVAAEHDFLSTSLDIRWAGYDGGSLEWTYTVTLECPHTQEEREADNARLALRDAGFDEALQAYRDSLQALGHFISDDANYAALPQEWRLSFIAEAEVWPRARSQA
ncbi:MAG: hypothetical protein Q7V62_03695 [Actinomycetota bacterium]|nr:hypothetical protein [Actinomycetota bacterium]